MVLCFIRGDMQISFVMFKIIRKIFHPVFVRSSAWVSKHYYPWSILILRCVENTLSTYLAFCWQKYLFRQWSQSSVGHHIFVSADNNIIVTAPKHLKRIKSFYSSNKTYLMSDDIILQSRRGNDRAKISWNPSEKTGPPYCIDRASSINFKKCNVSRFLSNPQQSLDWVSTKMGLKVGTDLRGTWQYRRRVRNNVANKLCLRQTNVNYISAWFRVGGSCICNTL